MIDLLGEDVEGFLVIDDRVKAILQSDITSILRSQDCV